MRIDPNPSRSHPDCPALSEADLLPDPVQLFLQWHDDAKQCAAIIDSNAMCLSTAGADGFPEGRMVLLREIHDGGFVFYSNSQSTKGLALEQHPRAAITFYWDPLRRQIRIQGAVEQLSKTHADEYFAARPRKSQIGAWASEQSRPLESRAILEERIAQFSAQFEGKVVPRPPHWQGYRIIPRSFEFWQERDNRLHDRFRYEVAGGGWKTARLYP